MFLECGGEVCIDSVPATVYVYGVVEEGWCGPGDDFLVDLEGCPTADFPSVSYIVGSDGTVVFERLNEEGSRGRGAPWAVSGGGWRIIVFLPDVPVQCTPVLFGEGCLG